jgi:hypothetical protein
MTLDGTLHALASMQASLPGVKRTYAYPPSRQHALTDFASWINTYTLTDVLGWGDLRIERYGITAQLFVKDADTGRGAITATSIGSAFLKAWDETHGELEGQTVGTDLRTLTPTLGMLDWAGQAYAGCQFLIDADVSVPTETPFSDPVLTGLRDWTAEHFPAWQQDPHTWAPSNEQPAIYWHYVTLPAPTGQFLTLSHQWLRATLAARLATPARTARTLHTVALSRRLGQFLGGWDIPMPESWLHLEAVRAWPEVDPAAEGQLLLDVRFVVDELWPEWLEPQRLLQATQYLPEGVHVSVPPPNPVAEGR